VLEVARPSWEKESYFAKIEEGPHTEPLLKVTASETRTSQQNKICRYKVITPNVPFEVDNQGRFFKYFAEWDCNHGRRNRPVSAEIWEILLFHREWMLSFRKCSYTLNCTKSFRSVSHWKHERMHIQFWIFQIILHVVCVILCRLDPSRITLEHKSKTGKVTATVSDCFLRWVIWITHLGELNTCLKTAFFIMTMQNRNEATRMSIFSISFVHQLDQNWGHKTAG
jgi:hypothetical protein